MTNKVSNYLQAQPRLLIIDNFLAKPTVEAFVYILERWQADFEDSVFLSREDSQLTVNKNKRSSLVLNNQPEIFLHFMKSKIAELEVSLKENFNYSLEWNKEFRFEIAASNDGDFFTPHTDSYPDIPLEDQLKVSMVYYFHREPKPFNGGELFIWDQLKNEDGTLSDEFPNEGIKIEPINNRIIFFDSTCLHEVLPISCPSKDFMDSRFVITMGFS
jgi:SM-20-related protein